MSHGRNKTRDVSRDVTGPEWGLEFLTARYMHLTTKCGGGGTVMPPPTFCHYELRRSLIAQKFGKFETLWEKITRNSNLLLKLRYFKKKHFFWPTTPTLGFVCNLALTWPNMLMMPQKLKLIVFSSLERFWGPWHFWWGNTNFQSESNLIDRPTAPYTGLTTKCCCVFEIFHL